MQLFSSGYPQSSLLKIIEAKHSFRQNSTSYIYFFISDRFLESNKTAVVFINHFINTVFNSLMDISLQQPMKWLGESQIERVILIMLKANEKWQCLSAKTDGIKLRVGNVTKPFSRFRCICVLKDNS